MSEDEGTSDGETERGAGAGEQSTIEPSEFEQQWDETRREPSRAPGPAPYLSPYVCLYAGFALGPAATFVVACLVSWERLTVRRAAIFFALAGLVWSVVQGGTFLTGGEWGKQGFRMFRAGANFVGGVGAVVVWRLEDLSAFRWNRGVLIRSLGAGALLMAGLFGVPVKYLLYLGW